MTVIVSPQYAYLVFAAIFGFIWLVFYVRCPETRKTQLIISLLAMLLGPIIEILYFRDYWYPLGVYPIGKWPYRLLVEDLLFSFSFTGMVGMLSRVFGKEAFVLELRGKKRYLLWLGALSIIISLPLIWLGLNSIWATSLGFLAVAVKAAGRKEEAIIYSVLCGFLTAAGMMLVFEAGYHIVTNSQALLESMWLLYGKPYWGARLLDTPLDWLAWGLCFGTMAGAVRHRLFT